VKSLGVLLIACAACSDDGSPARPDPTSLVVSATFPVTTTFGANASYLQKYIGTTLSWEITVPTPFVDRYMSTEDCANTDVHFADAMRVVTGSIPEAQAELLDPLDRDWIVSYEWCTDPARSSVSIASVIDPYNLSFGCADVPADAQELDHDGFPRITSVAARRCGAIVLDVINEVSVGNDSFEMAIEAK
jgi:hypothetical protein